MDILYKDWHAQGVLLFGEDQEEWLYVCPGCGGAQSLAQFEKLGIEGAEKHRTMCLGNWVRGGCSFDYKDHADNKLKRVKLYEGRTLPMFDFFDKSQPNVNKPKEKKKVRIRLTPKLRDYDYTYKKSVQEQKKLSSEEQRQTIKQAFYLIDQVQKLLSSANEFNEVNKHYLKHDLKIISDEMTNELDILKSDKLTKNI